MRTTSAAFTIASLVIAVACGGSDSKGVTNPNQNKSAGTLSARIDGAVWTAALVSVGVNTNGLIIAGSSASGQGLAIGASRLQGTGAQTFGTNVSALGTLTLGTQSWSATGLGGSGSSGTVTLTTLTTNRAVGTFAFTATPLAGGATTNRVVTSGAFDVTF